MRWQTVCAIASAIVFALAVFGVGEAHPMLAGGGALLAASHV